jgi:hydroxymethylpyrimidine pyrophosphatase-like HAD family hydrolase
MREHPWNLYSKGERVDQKDFLNEHQESSQLFGTYLERIKNGTSEPLVCFDVDGTLIPSTDYQTGYVKPIETSKNPETIEDYIEKNQDSIDKFKKRILSLQRFGFKFMINTGRGVEFTKRLVEHIFPEHSVSVIIGESGAGILEATPTGEWKDTLTKPDTVESSDYEVLKTNKESIEKIAKDAGGFLEKGKQVIISVNPPEGITTEEFQQTMIAEMKQIGIDTDSLHITRSASAVDIGPRGATKLASLKQMLGSDNIAIYFGDARNDSEALRGSDVNIVVGNAENEVQEIAKEASFGLVLERDKVDMQGCIEGLRSLEAFIRLGGITRKE